jgi:hypothetical protein
MEIRIKIHKTYIIDRYIHSLKTKISKGCELVNMEISIADGKKIHCSALMPNDGCNVVKVYNIEKRKSIRRRSSVFGHGYRIVKEPTCIAYVYYIPLRVLSSAGLSVEQKSRHFVLTKAGAPVRK